MGIAALLKAASFKNDVATGYDNNTVPHDSDDDVEYIGVGEGSSVVGELEEEEVKGLV